MVIAVNAAVCWSQLSSGHYYVHVQVATASAGGGKPHACRAKQVKR
ncbi:hypothetical protein ACQP2F_15595 [Actinoplanes sp. CA-030573]